LMAEGRVLPYLDIPFQACQPIRTEDDAPSRPSRKDDTVHRKLAGDMSGSRRPFDLHRWLPWRDRAWISPRCSIF
jgi:hypothetical protein